jgi:hypothetical protein
MITTAITAAYFRFNASRQFALALRCEHFENQNGARTGVTQKLREVTHTPEFRSANEFVVRGDFRLDFSNHNVFEKGGSFTDKQLTVCASVLFVY